MLLVNSFKPIQTNYNNQNVNKVNLNQPQLRTKADSVSFSSSISECDKAAQAKVQALALHFRADNYNILGFGFPRFARQMIRFLGEQRLSLWHKPGPIAIRTRPEPAASCDEVLLDGFKATLYDTLGNPIHNVGDGLPGQIGDSVIDVTENAASVGIFHKLLTGNMRFVNPLDFLTTLPASSEAMDMLAPTRSITYKLAEFQREWLKIHYDNQHQKALDLQAAFRNLMPEK